MMRAPVALMLAILSAPGSLALAQNTAAPTPDTQGSSTSSEPDERSGIADAFAKEWAAIKKGCSGGGIKAIASCAVPIVTGQPLHFAFGSLAPQSGLGLGAALVGHKNFVDSPWRLHWSGDAVAARSGSWRAGAYFNFDHVEKTEAGGGISSSNDDSADAPDPNTQSNTTMYSAYVQATSLDKLLFYGIGPDSLRDGESRWLMKQTIVGGAVNMPVPSGSANLSLIGSLNGRFFDVRGSSADEDTPSLTDVYSEVSAPGLANPEATFLQVTGGVRAQPSWFGRRVSPYYSLTADRFVSDSQSKASFTRVSLELTHEFPFYETSKSTRIPQATAVSPNECSDSGDVLCDATSFDRDGGISISLMATGSWARDGHAVPFYLQPTLGGGDVNGMPLLSGFSDYRFRAPNTIAVQERFDHSIPGTPLGFVIMAEQGKVALRPGALGFSDLEHTIAAGLTMRAGGFPLVFLVFARSHEGNHTVFRVNPSLLGGSARPSLF